MTRKKDQFLYKLRRTDILAYFVTYADPWPTHWQLRSQPIHEEPSMCNPIGSGIPPRIGAGFWKYLLTRLRVMILT